MTKAPSELKKMAALEPALQKKRKRLESIIRQAGSALVAFSGGVDSTFLAKTCQMLLGDQMLAVTARSATFPQREFKQALDLARQWKLAHHIVDSNEIELAEFAANPPERCYYCKKTLFSGFLEIAAQRGLAWVFDGGNHDDRHDFRPGRRAVQELGVRSPLEEAGLGKDEIRRLSQSLDLPTWDKPAAACLASRFPYHSPITVPALRQVEKAEDVLWALGMRIFRVRHHDRLARLELGPAEMQIALNHREAIVNQFKALGYTQIVLDLQGYRTGSMNEAIEG